MATREQRPIIREPHVLVFKEKHGDRYFHVPDDAALFAAALSVLTERKKEGYWYYKPEKKPEPPDVTEEQVATLPKSVQVNATVKIRAYKDALRRYEEEVEDFEEIERAVREKDGRAAWQILSDHGDGEYEGYDLERYEKVS